MRAALFAVLLAGCVETGITPVEPVPYFPDPGPGYPPKMGEVTGQLGGTAVAWETYDFSIGAFDGSAWVEHFDGPYRLHITGYPPGKPRSRDNLLRVVGVFSGRPAPGALGAVEVKVGAEGGTQGATLVVERIEVPPGSGYGSATGRVTAALCPTIPGSLAPCRLFEARFETRIQFNG